MRHLTAVLLLILVVPTPSAAAPESAATILDGVLEIAAPGVPGPLALLSPDAFALVTGGKSGEAVVAAAPWRRGRVVAFGHTGYFGKAALETADTGRLLVQAARWAAGNRRTVRFFAGRHRAVAGLLRAAGFVAADEPDDAHLLVLGSHDLSPEDVANAAAHAGRGGGLLVAGLGWGWKQLNPGRSLPEQHPGNRLLAPAGIVWADGTLDRTSKQGYAVRDDRAGAAAHAALDLLAAQAEGRAKPAKGAAARAAAILTRAAQAAPESDRLLLPRLSKFGKGRGEGAFPTAATPLGPDRGLDRVLLALDVRRMRSLAPEDVRPHPAAAAFPGAVPRGAKREKVTIVLDTTVPGRHSTGRYAAPGEVVTVTVPSGAERLGLSLRIGAHSDRLWHQEKWSRVPEIDRTVKIREETTRLASPFGGLVYLETLREAGGHALEVRIEGAVAAPLFVLGETKPEEWRKTIRGRPGPWAELATAKVIVTVPSESIRDLADPEPLLRLWDEVMDACADLAARPRTRERPERYVADVQISAGYMHAGYPIMTHLDAAAAMVSETKLRAGNWGLFHEMGHNHQDRTWTFNGTVEVTCNLFTLYVLETVCGKERGQARKNLPVPAAKIEAYRATGPDFARWKKDPFLALTMYDQLIDAFGWDLFKDLFAEYRKLPANERPKADPDKRDQWLVRLSRRTGKNLGPFFDWWGVPVSEQAKREVAELPTWMPE